MAIPGATFRKLKVLLVGDKDTGKHCYIRRLIDNKYPRDSWTNKECDTWSLKIKIEHILVPVQLFIIQGAARGKTVVKKHYKDTDGYLLMFDVTNAISYDHVPNWKKDIEGENQKKLPPCILLANKCDLEKDNDVNLQMQGINDYCDALGFRAHFETSCKDNIAIQQSFLHLIREIIQLENSSLLTADSRSRSSTTASEPRVDRLPSLTKEEYTIKIIVIGERATGKTAIIQRYVRNVFSTYYKNTVGADLGFKKINHNNRLLNVHIWDIAGDERFGSMTQLFYKDAAGCLIVFDESKYSTLLSAVKWKEDFDLKVNYDPTSPVPCVLVGNKCDLPKDGMIQSAPHMKEFCQKHRFLRWFETSARESINVTDTFNYLINQIMDGTGRTGVRRRAHTDVIQVHDPLIQNDTERNCCHT